eukprot:TRINITY_DN4385_c0_g1_i5.p2 TRINITY_DN4385_c0_g1~~TRINITY_DN4385_c0_g1_i5.p2  ORF type:complete len:130 (-),score=55.60 TRINITY_DN4385_c0_g1_i5:146-535(-)
MPMWEDKKNREGGRWVLRVQKGYTSKLWEEIVMAIIGNQLHEDNEICGAVVSRKADFDMISIWNMHGNDPDIKGKVESRLKEVLELPREMEIQYIKHYTEGGAGGFKKAQGKFTKKTEHGIYRAKQGDS